MNTIIPSPFGCIEITINDDKLISLTLKPTSKPRVPSKHPTAKHITNELNHYFKNPKHRFSIDFSLSGTPFQQAVWHALQQIPSGKTLTYGELAKKLNSHARAIGQACRTNPIAIIIPCHRIVAAQDLGGFAGKKSGAMMNIKRWLLTHENNC